MTTTIPRRVFLSAVIPALLALAALAPAAPRAQDFLVTVDDVPVMPGLTEVPGSGFVFDKPDGRIAEATARGPVTRAAVLAFYAETLPQLGWTMAAAGRFRRDDEGLTLTFSTQGRDLIVRFQVAPLIDR